MSNSHHWKWKLRVALAVLVIIGAAAGWWFLTRADSPTPSPDSQPDTAEESVPDPRLTFPTPFRNVKPDVQYVGDAACKGCHADVDQKFHAHPMGRSAEFVARSAGIERFDEAAHNPTRSGPYELRAEKVDGKLVHRMSAKDPDGKPLPDYVTTADLAIGSGTRGRSYLSVENGEVWQTPLSWYTSGARWDVSPGFDLGTGSRRPIGMPCLFCHVNRVEPVTTALNRYHDPFPVGAPAIGCERCHGPGALHVAERTTQRLTGAIDTSIVNPKHLSSELQESICAQCHLQGQQRIIRRGRELNEFRPGLPFDAFVTVFVRHPDVADLQRSVGQFEQMHRSTCNIASAGRMVCTSCHDPHGKPQPEQRERFFGDRCKNCHGPNSKECSEALAVRKAKNDSCVACHMPARDSSNIVHASVTDHRILRRPSAASGPRGLPPGAMPLVEFVIGAQTHSARDQDRDLGIALTSVALRIPGQSAEKFEVAAAAERLLEGAVVASPRDGLAWVALSQVRNMNGDDVGRFDAASRAAQVNPASELALQELAEASRVMGRMDDAIAAATSLVTKRPTAVEPLLLRTAIYLEQRDWKKAEADCLAALKIHPLHAQARAYYAVCRYRQGDVEGGRKQVEIAEELIDNPQRKSALMQFYQQQIR